MVQRRETERSFVIVQGDVYAFYRGSRIIAKVKSPDMSREMIEAYRRDHYKLLSDLDEQERDPEPPEVA